MDMTMTREQYLRSVEKTGHSPYWKPSRYANLGTLSGRDMRPKGQTARALRAQGGQ